MAKLKLTLVVDVDYDYDPAAYDGPNAKKQATDELMNLLEYVPAHACGEGMFTGETSAVVDNWYCKVTKRIKKRR